MCKQPGDIWRLVYRLNPDDDDERELQEARVRARVQQHLDCIGETTPLAHSRSVTWDQRPIAYRRPDT